MSVFAEFEPFLEVSNHIMFNAIVLTFGISPCVQLLQYCTVLYCKLAGPGFAFRYSNLYISVHRWLVS
jgi:hypothetical protein